MATKRLVLQRDANNLPTNLMPLGDSQDVDGTGASAQSTAIDGYAVRIKSLDNQLRFLIGNNPTALATSPALEAFDEIYQPIIPGQKVAIFGGKANICVVGV